MRRRARQRGLAIVTFSMVAAVAVPFMGLAIDGAMLVVVKERLTTAVDSAAKAAARYPADETKQDSAARRFLDANFPEGYMGTGARTIAVDKGRVEVRITAPAYFLRLLHVKGVEVVAARAILWVGSPDLRQDALVLPPH